MWQPKTQSIGMQGYDNCEYCQEYCIIYSWGEINADLPKLCYDCFYDIPKRRRG